ncbi:MAG: hypothetical protein JWR54_2236 [Mucilaginibacter sp.]|nr:hypothetical protein [Mucilaginibacter sp.]
MVSQAPNIKQAIPPNIYKEFIVIRIGKHKVNEKAPSLTHDIVALVTLFNST